MTASPDLGSGAPPALPPLFPFAAIAGQPLLCQALLLLLVRPHLDEDARAGAHRQQHDQADHHPFDGPLPDLAHAPSSLSMLCR